MFHSAKLSKGSAEKTDSNSAETTVQKKERHKTKCFLQRQKMDQYQYLVHDPVEEERKSIKWAGSTSKNISKPTPQYWIFTQKQGRTQKESRCLTSRIVLKMMMFFFSATKEFWEFWSRGQTLGFRSGWTLHFLDNRKPWILAWMVKSDISTDQCWELECASICRSTHTTQMLMIFFSLPCVNLLCEYSSEVCVHSGYFVFPNRRNVFARTKKNWTGSLNG